MERDRAGGLALTLGNARWPLQVRPRAGGAHDSLHDVTLGDVRHALTVYASGERISIFAAAGSATVLEIDPIAHAADGAVAEGGRLTAPMPGKVVAFMTKAGDSVKRGQALAVMEAMKMEHTITAPRDGVVKELLYAVGDQVAEGGELLSLEAA